MTKKGPACRQAGLSLIEVIIVMGVVVIIGSLLMVIMVNSTTLFTKQSAKLEEGLNINDTLAQVRSNIKDASSIAPSYTSGGTTYTSGLTQLVIKLPSIDSSNNIILNAFDSYVFFLYSNQMRMKTFPSPQSTRKVQDQIFSNTVDSLKFQYFNSGIPPMEVSPATAVKVRITLTLKRKVAVNSYETVIATSEANLRND